MRFLRHAPRGMFGAETKPDTGSKVGDILLSGVAGYLMVSGIAQAVGVEKGKARKTGLVYGGVLALSNVFMNYLYKEASAVRAAGGKIQ